MENIVVALFKIESEGYQAATELKQNPGDAASFVSQAVLVKKEGGRIRPLDAFDTGLETSDDTAIGGLVGMCIGILGGPIGMLLGGSLGALTGMSMDTGNALDNASLLEQIAGKLSDGDVALLALAREDSAEALDAKLTKYQAVIMRYDAAVVAQEVESAREIQREMERNARSELRKQKSDEFKGKIEAKREEVKAHFEEFKEKHFS